MSNTDLTGKIALVTGGSRGLGKAMVKAFAEAGASVAIASRKIDACEELAGELRAQGVDARAYGCHVGRWDDIEPFVDKVYADFGRVDILVNNAGMSPLYSSLEEISEANFDSVIGVNFKGPFRLTTLVGGRMHKSNGGSIINISSIASLRGSPRALPYSAAKSALNALTWGFASAYAPNVRVNAIAVGSFGTDVAEHWRDPPNHDNPGYTLGGRRIGRPDEITGAALYLASDLSSFTNAEILRLDGGEISGALPIPTPLG